MKLPPPSVLASWPVPNYINPQTRGNALVVLNAVFLALASIAVLLRIYTRLFIRKWFGLDDVLIVVAFVCTIALNVFVVIGATSLGWSRHEWDIPLDMVTTSLKYAYVCKMLFLVAGFATALSLLAFYYRLIAESGSSWFRWALHASVAFTIIGWIPFVLTQIFLCTPIHAYWDLIPPAGARCLDEGKATIVGGIVKTLVDLLITTLPIPFVLRTHMQKRQRYGVAVLFGLGYVVTAAGAIRAYYTYFVFTKTYDQTWYQYPAFLASAVENNLGVICACIPTIRPLFPHFFGVPITRIKVWLSDRSSSSSNPHSSSNPTNDKHGTSRPKLHQVIPSHISSFPSTTNHSNSRRYNSRLPSIMRQSFSWSIPSISEHEHPSEIKLVIQKNTGELESVVELEDLPFDGRRTLYLRSQDGADWTERGKIGGGGAGGRKSRSYAVPVSYGHSAVHPFDPRCDGKEAKQRDWA